MVKYLVDFDSTLSNTFGAILPHVNAKFGTKYTEHDFTSWKTEDFMPLEHAMFMWGEEGFLSDDVQLSAEPVEHAIEGVRKLLERGDQAIIVSDRPMRLFYTTRNWLTKQGLGDIPLEFTRSKLSKSDGSGRTKAQVAWQNRLTHIIEDAPHHAESFAKRHFINRVYLLDYPHNRAVVPHDKIVRVESWKEIA